jgi:hypothetical protein
MVPSARLVGGNRIHKMVKRILTAISPGILLCALSVAQEKPEQNVDWSKIRDAFRVYCESPTAANAINILAELPEELGRTVDQKQWQSTLDYIFGPIYSEWAGFVRKGDRSSLQFTLKLINITDGWYTENLCSLIGTTIRVNPTLFLEEMNNLGKNAFLLSNIVAGIDAEEYPPEVAKKEIKFRIESLKTVNRPDLIDLRDRCIRLLEKELKIFERIYK